MSLPSYFNNPEEYYQKCIQFLEEYQYLYNVSNVELLIHDVLDKIDANVEGIEIFDENTDLAAVDDNYLSTFFSKLKRFQAIYDDFCPNDVEDDIDVPVSAKKKHEIIYLAKEINEVCGQVGCDVVVDFGSGLGYLDQLIFETTSYKVLGIECNESHYVGAKKRQRKYHLNSIDHVKYIKHTIHRDSHEKIKGFLEEKFEHYQRFCITGLHACADLTIDAIDIFLKMNEATAIVIMPCCYHKMVEENGKFKNFPLSKCLKDIIKKTNGDKKFGVPFLRLATQPPNVEEKLRHLVFNLLSRAVLQLYAHKHNYKLKRNRRKAVKTKTMDNNFDSYIQDAATNGFALIKNESSVQDNNVENATFDLEELKTLWNEISSTRYKRAAIYIILQNHLQAALENFVLYDRLLYLKENGVQNCRFKKILNESTSPRCLALVAYKDK